MDSSLKPVIKRQVIFVGASLGAGLLLTYFFGFFVGMAANVAIFVAAIFFIRWRQQKALRSLGLGSQTAGRGFEQEGVKLKYVCLSCGAEVKGTKCGACGSQMKKPLF
ncbi:hypothetical protein [Nitrososphaera sp.]|uniref:hypothetical protein n=1 Tax=Nitrososphaera sp. TaxID=1971748 RepID=UPI0017A961B5|nr:hypothetical protein [Nitrososphaera sp.]NWG36319.1 hypothetical protein [Nitrososphaera sp.]